jgi:hypothetical protein
MKNPPRVAGTSGFAVVEVPLGVALPSIDEFDETDERGRISAQGLEECPGPPVALDQAKEQELVPRELLGDSGGF